MADFIIHKSNNYKVIIASKLSDIFIHELSPFAKFFGVSFEIDKQYIYGHITKEKQPPSYITNELFSLSIELDKKKKTLEEELEYKDWIFANKISSNFNLNETDIGIYRPLELNYDKLRVAFDKGCFRGQEIIARMKYLGVDRRKFINIISQEKISESKNLKILGEILNYKGYCVANAIIKKDSIKEYNIKNPETLIF